MRNIAELARAMRAYRVSKILKMERQTERKHDSVGECTPFECASVDSWQCPRLSYMSRQLPQASLRTISCLHWMAQFIRVRWPSINRRRQW